MISINKNNDTITITGHSIPVVCAGVSAVFYTTVNALLEYDSECITVYDDSDNDAMTINIIIDDEFVTLWINNMFNMFRDIHKAYPNGLKIKME